MLSGRTRYSPAEYEDPECIAHTHSRLSFSKVLILRNHGLVAVGSCVEECFHIMYNLIQACQIQVSGLATIVSLQTSLRMFPGGRCVSWSAQPHPNPTGRGVWSRGECGRGRSVENKGADGV